MDFKHEIKKRTEQIEAILARYLPREAGCQRTVVEAMRYSFLAGGKRLRPMLMRETYRLFGGDSSLIEPFMAAIEMIHTYSLIHDDLPAMDDDDYRRGKKTVHIVYGEAMAILAGDGLLNLAYETALSAFDMDDADVAPGSPGAVSGSATRNIARALQILAHSAGIRGMVGGQVADVESEGQPIAREKLDFIYELKTGALIRAAMEVGAVLAGADAFHLKMLSQAAKDIGLAFQIRDDILDVAGDQRRIGKPVGSDAKNGKTTYVTIHGLAQANADVEILSARAVAALRGLPVQNAFLDELILFLIGREA